MALIFWDGFDSYDSFYNISLARPQVSLGGYPGREPCKLIRGYGRFGGTSIMASSSSTGYLDISSSAASEIYTGRAININGYNNFFHIYEQTDNGGSYPTPAVTCQYSGGYIYIYRGKGIDGYGTDVNKVLIGQSAFNAFQLGVWNYVELRLKMSSSSTTNDGIVEFWVNNNKIISNTACVTKNYSSTYYKGMGICMEFWDGNSNQSTNATDDIYVLDTTGPAPWNTRLGDCRIVSIAVNSDAGPNDGTVSSGNTNHWTVVDEIPYSAADWLQLSSLSSDAGEIFKKASIPSTNVFSVLATAVVAIGGKTDAGNAAFKLSLQSAGTRANSNTQYLSTTNTFFRQEWVTNPNTSSQWTTSEWEAANVGVYIV